MSVESKLYFKGLLQSAFNKFGYHLNRLNKNVSLFDSFSEQVRLTSPDAAVIFDVGANEGRTIREYRGAFPAAHIYAFEPLDIHLSQLTELSKDDANISVFKMAVSDKSGASTFFETALSDSSSLYKPLQTGAQFDEYHKLKKEQTIELTTIDDFCGDHGLDQIDLLKLDIQGGEYDALVGASGLLREKKIGVIYCEVQFYPLYEAVPLFHQIATLLESFGYQLHNLYNLNYTQNGRLSWGDAIFLPSK